MKKEPLLVQVKRWQQGMALWRMRFLYFWSQIEIAFLLRVLGEYTEGWPPQEHDS